MRAQTWMAAAAVVALTMFACGNFGADEPDPIGDAGTGGRDPARDAARDTGPAPDAIAVDPSTGVPPGMVKIEASVPFFIDAREASVGLYNTVQAAHTWESLNLPQACNGDAHSNGWGDRTTCNTPIDTQDVTTADGLPANCIDWCDALAFCVAQGKRLCGKMGGEPFPTTTDTTVLEDQAVNATDGEWTYACAGAAGNIQPYGTTTIAARCNDTNSIIERSGEFVDCEGSVPGLYDMSGNLNEWEAACTGDEEQELCLVRGGAYRSGTDATGCFKRRNGGFPVRIGRYDDVGVRCCADVPR